MNSGKIIVSHLKIYKVKLRSAIIPCDGTENLSPDTKKFIKSKSFEKQLKNFIYGGSAFDLNIAGIKIKSFSHSFIANRLICKMTLCISQALEIGDIQSHLKWSFGTFSKSGTFNGSFKYKNERFCFDNEILEIIDTGKLCGIKIFLNSRVLF